MGRLIRAVTIDAYGTLLELEDPVPALAAALRARGVERSPEETKRAFHAEMRYYREHAVEGRDPESLATLRRDCARVFLAEARAALPADDFAPAFMASLCFRLLDGVEEALEALESRGLRLAVISNWDAELPAVLEGLGAAARFDTIVTSAAVGAAKPDRRIFDVALERLGTAAERTVHTGDDPADEAGARAAGMRFVPPPLANVVEAVS
jgi:HAD superfamily hydrolase (TIGR01509 family)